MNIVFCTTVLPSRKRTGGEIASQSFIDAMRVAGHSVTVLGYQRPDDDYGPSGGEVCVGRRPIETDGAGLSKYLWMLEAITRGRAYSAQKYHSASYQHLLSSELVRQPQSLVVIDHAQMGFLLDVVPSECPVLFIAHNIEEDIYRAQIDAASNPFTRWLVTREAKLIGLLERRIGRRALCVWVLTEADRAHFANSGCRHVSIAEIPATRFGSGNADCHYDYDVGLIGTWSWRANAEGLEWFQREIVPRLPRNLRIAVAGKGAESIVRPPVKALGFVSDAVTFLEGCAVIAIPSTAGGGIQVKTLDAIATGRPVVATQTALRGIDRVPGSVCSADTADAFASAIERACRTAGNVANESLEWSRARGARFRNVIETEISYIENRLT
ncbi:glycosyltransferase [Methyloversatilis discipulorum]|uniref:glycosyltransferase n=1 Tax=Methyloversatilis discipulorum TaxID=1119528 RepID=UPI0009DACE95|nr:glycosyltransferase [Methyloversatilis discipulorum]